MINSILIEKAETGKWYLLINGELRGKFYTLPSLLGTLIGRELNLKCEGDEYKYSRKNE